MAGKYLKKSVLELGGCDALVFFDPVLKEEDVELAFKSRARNLGQICNSPKRIFVREEVFDLFVAKLVRKIEE